MAKAADLVGEQKMPEDREALRQLVEEFRKVDESIRRNIDAALALEKRISEIMSRFQGVPENERPAVKIPPAVSPAIPDPRPGPSMSAEKVSVGIEKLDELLVGGMRPGTNALLTGPPFSGKYVLAWNFVAKSLDEGIPVVVITADRDIGEIKYEISRIYRNVEEAEASGLLRFIDVYSRVVQAKSPSKYATVIDSTTNVSSLVRAAEQIGIEVRKSYPYYRLLFSSLNVYLAELEDKTLVKFLQQFAQRRKAESAVSLYLIEEGQSEKRPSDSVSYLFDGILEFKSDSSKNYMRVSGLGNVRSRDWVELYLNEISFDLGSFTLEKIR